MKAWRRWLLRLAVVMAVLVVVALVPGIAVETGCRPAAQATNRVPYQPVLAPEHRRPMTNTLLTYPEWYIVHAYDDFAAVQNSAGETAFDYVDSIGGYWRTFCQVRRIAGGWGPIPVDTRVMLHVIGASFTMELAFKGLYEKSVGALTQWLRGTTPTAEDRFSAQVAADYAAFLRHTPWYEFPFGDTLVRFWRETPFESAAWMRSVERRFALSTEWGAKWAYAKLIGAAAGITPAPRAIRSVVQGMDNSDAQADPRIKVVERPGKGTVVIETPRYREFTDIVRGLAQRQRRVVEIAGNDRVFVTVLGDSNKPFAPSADVDPITVVRVQGRPGAERRGMIVPVAQLTALIRTLPTNGLVLEHVYDY